MSRVSTQSSEKASAAPQVTTPERRLRILFTNIASLSAKWMGTYWAFRGAVVVVVGWAATGPYFGYSDTWQLVINTSTTIITFLMVFLIQHSQNRDSRAMQLKLDELIVAVKDAHNEMVDIESLSDVDMELVAKRFEEMKARGECGIRTNSLFGSPGPGL